MNGLHLIADLDGCLADAEWLTDCSRLERWLPEICTAHGLTVVGCYFHQFHGTPVADGERQAAGVTGAVVLAESHLTLHTWPETARVAFDIYVCNVRVDKSASARELAQALVSRFAPDRVILKEIQRFDG